MSTQTVKLELDRFTEIRRRILESDPDVDDITLADTLEGATDLKEAIAGITRSAIEDESLLGAAKTRLDELKTRMDRLKLRIDRKRAIALSAMEDAGIEALIEPDFTMSLRSVPQSVVVTDEAQIPEWFWIPQDPKLDKRALLDALKGGTIIGGAELSNKRRTLSVTTK